MSLRQSVYAHRVQRAAGTFPTSLHNFTIAVCVKLQAAPTTGKVMALYAQGASGNYVAIDSAASLFGQSEWDTYSSASAGTLTAGGASGSNWYFVAWRGTGTGAGGMKVSLKPVGSGSLVHRDLRFESATTGLVSLLLGSPFTESEANSYGIYGFNGFLAHLKIFNRALTDAELAVESTQAAPAATNLLSYHSFVGTNLTNALQPTQGTGAFEIFDGTPSLSTDDPVFATAPTLTGSDTLPSVRTAATGDALAASDTASATRTLAANTTEVAQAADSTSLAQRLLVTRTEPATAIDSSTGTNASQTFPVSASESASSSDSAAASHTLVVGPAEAATGLDSAGVQHRAVASHTEAATALDSPATAATLTASRTELVTAGDSATSSDASRIISTSSTEALAAGDSATTKVVASAGASESFVVFDSGGATGGISTGLLVPRSTSTEAARNSRLPDLPVLPADTPTGLRRLLEPLREYVQVIAGRRGDTLDTAVTFRDLISSGVVEIDIGKISRAGTPPITLPVPGELIDFATPPAPSNLVATAAVASVILQWGGTGFRSYAYTEIWRAESDNLSGAVRVGTSGSQQFSDNRGNSTTAAFYWVRFVSKAGVVGPFNRTQGTSGGATQDPSYLIDVLSETYGQAAVANAPFFYVPSTTTINGVSVPQGTYIKSAFIANATITSAQIRDLAADKITAGYVSAAIGFNGSSMYGANLYSGGSVNVSYDAQNNVTGFTAVNPTFKVEGGVVDIRAAAFNVLNDAGSGSVRPFIVTGNTVYIDGARVGNYIRSGNFDNTSNPKLGFNIDAVTGNAEFYNATIRGSLNASDITSGTLSTERISVGALGRQTNLLKNSDWTETSSRFPDNTPGSLLRWQWACNLSAGGSTQTPPANVEGFRRFNGGREWNVGNGGMWMRDTSSAAITAQYIFSDFFPVTSGTEYEFSVYSSTHRCNAYVYIEWYNSSFGGLGSSQGVGGNAGSSIVGQKFGPVSMARWWGTGTSPANAAFGRMLIVKEKTNAGQSDSYLFAHRAMVCAKPTDASVTNQTEWADSGLTVIDGGSITTGSITAETGAIANLAVNTLQLAGNAVTVPDFVDTIATSYTIANGAPQNSYQYTILSRTITLPSQAASGLSSYPFVAILSSPSGGLGQSSLSTFVGYEVFSEYFIRVTGGTGSSSLDGAYFSLQGASVSGAFTYPSISALLTLRPGTNLVEVVVAVTATGGWNGQSSLSFNARSMLLLGAKK